MVALEAMASAVADYFRVESTPYVDCQGCVCRRSSHGWMGEWMESLCHPSPLLSSSTSSTYLIQLHSVVTEFQLDVLTMWTLQDAMQNLFHFLLHLTPFTLQCHILCRFISLQDFYCMLDNWFPSLDNVWTVDSMSPHLAFTILEMLTVPFYCFLNSSSYIHYYLLLSIWPEFPFPFIKASLS